MSGSASGTRSIPTLIDREHRSAIRTRLSDRLRVLLGSPKHSCFAFILSGTHKLGLWLGIFTNDGDSDTRIASGRHPANGSVPEELATPPLAWYCSADMILDLNQLDPKAIYALMIQSIVPRPIAWVLSDNGDHSYNLAPFSYFNGVSSKPPILSLSIGKKRDGSKKDTWVNIEKRKHFVVHIAQCQQAQSVSASAASLPFGSSEITANELETAGVTGWNLPRLAEAKIAMWCQLHQIVEVGDTPQALVLGRIEQLYLNDDFAQDGLGPIPKIDLDRLDPLARLGGDDYSALGDSFTVSRPA